MGDYRFLSLFGSILLVVSLDLLSEVVLFGPDALEYWKSINVVRPVVLATLLLFFTFLIPGYLIAVLWEKDEFLGGVALAACSFPIAYYLNHVPFEPGMKILNFSVSYYHVVSSLGIVLGAVLRSEFHE